MGWVKMSEREVDRVEVLAQVDDGRLSVDNAANMMNLTRRQVFRLLKGYRQNGAAAIRHKSRGKPPNNLIHKAKREYVLTVIKEQYPDFGPTLAAEMLGEHHGFKVSRETLRKWMVENGIWLSRKQRRTFHQPRLHRECFGELIQIDGSDHRWFEDRAGPCTLLVFTDDATSTLMELRFVKSESTFSYFEQLTFSYDRKRIMLEESEVTRDLVGKYVDTYAFVDGRFEVRSKGRSLPCKIFDMDQRVTHAAITDNKRLGAVRAHIKDMQDKASPKYPVRTNSEKMGYKPRSRKPGRPSGSHAKKTIVQAAE